MAKIVPVFHKATRTQCKASIMLEGLSGRGKTGLALALAYYLADESWEEVYATDTEKESMKLYEGTTLHTGVRVAPFNVGDLSADDEYSPSNYKAFRDKAIELGGKVMLQDSVSHMWQYKGGILDMVTRAKQRDPSLNNYTAWGVPEIVTEKNLIFDLMRTEKMHSINTVRSKEKMEIIDDPEKQGKKKVQSLGEQQIMMPDLRYEPDLVLQMVSAGTSPDKGGHAPVAKVIKSRYVIFNVDEEYAFTKELLTQLREYLASGVDPAVLLEQQRQEYIQATRAFLDTNTSAKNIWPVLKENLGHKATKLDDMPLPVIKLLYGQLVSG
jgi:hypothetical protein